MAAPDDSPAPGFSGGVPPLPERDRAPPPLPNRPAAAFVTTRWSLVVAAGQEGTAERRGALEWLCRMYWFPVYAYIRRRVNDAHRAEDLTQEFFTRLLDKRTIAAADATRGRFRVFLLTACQRFLINDHHAARAVKRGGGRKVLSLDLAAGESKYAVEAVDTLTPERLYEQQWALTLLARVLETLRCEFDAKGRLAQFEELKPFLTGSGGSPSYAAVAERLGMSEGAVKVAIHRLRERYRQRLRQEVGQTVADGEVEEEIRSLIAVLGAGK